MMSGSDEMDLVRRLRNSDTEAFDIIFKTYSGKIYAFGLKYLKSTDDAEELVQGLFLKIWENRKNLDAEASLKSYLFTIAYNDICKFFRRRTYHQKFIEEVTYRNQFLSNVTEDHIDFQSVSGRIRQMVNELPEKQKLVFLKSREEGKSTKEIAEDTGLSAGTVDNYISEALKVLRRRIRKEDLAIVLFFSLFIL